MNLLRLLFALLVTLPLTACALSGGPVRDGVSGRGLADYSNRGFFSAGTNLGGNSYTSPSNDASSSRYVKESANGLLPGKPGHVISFLKGDVLDTLNSGSDNIKMTTESLFDAYLLTNKTYSLNRFNYDDMAGLLIPRAVAYSAGLINHFFRGKIDFVSDAINADKYTIKNLGAEDITGTLTLYYDAVDGKRYPVAGDTTTATWAWRTIAANGQLDNLGFTPPTTPAPKTPDEYMLVFKGNMGEEKAENGAVGAVIAKLIKQEGATDYVAMTMPNPIPYRGVNIGVVNKGFPYAETSQSVVFWPNGISRTITINYILYNSIGNVVGNGSGYIEMDWGGTDTQFGGFGTAYNFVGCRGSYCSRGGLLIAPNTPWYLVYGVWQPGVQPSPGFNAGSWSGGITSTSPSYESVLAADQATFTGGLHNYAVISSGEELTHEVQNSVAESGYSYLRYKMGSMVWGGSDSVWMFDVLSGSNYAYHHKLAFTVPEDGIYPVPPTTVPSYPGTDGLSAQWIQDWSNGVNAFKNRRQAWFKKNSDEFISALKTGFAADSGVSRTELQTGKLPGAWDFQIKRDVDVKYNNYPRDLYNVSVGRHTRRSVQYSEVVFSEDVQSDSSANLTQAGVKVTKREVILVYKIPMLQPDGTATTETRNTTITGYLTQTVTQHNDAAGNRLGLSRKDTYENWYNRESTTLPAGVPSTITASYLKDRTNSRIGIVLDGTVQNGYNADSSNGVPGNPLTYALYNPPYPKWSSTVQASTPDFIAQWHKDAEIEYLEDGVGASNALNDSALYGVKQIEITPVGLIADGNGNALAGTALGIFSSGEKGTQAEIYGTAVYNFDWQTGALTFNKWKPLLDAGGNEVASKVINLPAGTVFPINNAIITYKGLHWPDVIAALRVRDEGLPTATNPSDKMLYELIKAVKGG